MAPNPDLPVNNPAIVQRERDFSHAWARSMNASALLVEEHFSACTCPENRFILQALGPLSQKNICDLGCGMGEAALYFASRGAKVSALDISDSMLQVLKAEASERGLTIDTRQGSAMATAFSDATFDIVYAANLLHHVDKEITLLEIKRILKPGGVLACFDPLAHNPIINLYRRIVTKNRSLDEHPLSFKDRRLFKRYFTMVTVRTYWLLTLWIFIKYYLIDRSDPNMEKYWIKVVADHKKVERTYLFLERIDTILFRIFPFLKSWCWNMVVIARKDPIGAL
jgi:2-polyprenyl-3-methyl-5-hydroxy-6-metoxy-1,4-benzoquinol methylase